MTINKNTKDIATALASMAASHSELASKQMEYGGVDNEMMRKQLEMAMQDTQMIQQAMLQLLGGNPPSVSAPPVFIEKEAAASPSPTPAPKNAPLAEPAVGPNVSPAQVTQVPAPAIVQYALSLRIEKPCKSCPFAATCKDKKKSTFNPNCGVDALKEASVSAGPIEIEVAVDESTMETSFIAYKNGSYLSHLTLQRENKPLIEVLEDYMGQRVYLNTYARTDKKVYPSSIFTHLTAEIVRVEPLSVPRAASVSSEQEPPFLFMGEEPADNEPFYSEEDVAVEPFFQL